MKLLNSRLFMAFIVLFSAFGYISSCTHENDVLPPPASTAPIVTRGTSVHLPGNMTTANKEEWKLDKSHSSVLWQTNYVSASGLLTGRFNQFGTHDITDAEMTTYTVSGQPLKDNSWAFYESDPSKTFFNGYVQINTSNTGEPGRDAGCNLNAMGTTAIVAGSQNLTATNIARIKTTKVELDPLTSDYIVTFNLTWIGKLAAPFTKSITGRLKYISKSTINSAAPYDVFGLQLLFQFNCREFGITSTSISDKMEIICNMNFHNK